MCGFKNSVSLCWRVKNGISPKRKTSGNSTAWVAWISFINETIQMSNSGCFGSFRSLWSKQKDPWWFKLYIGGLIYYRVFLAIILSHYKNPYEPISTMGWDRSVFPPQCENCFLLFKNFHQTCAVGKISVFLSAMQIMGRNFLRASIKMFDNFVILCSIEGVLLGRKVT